MLHMYKKLIKYTFKKANQKERMKVGTDKLCVSGDCI